ncbi:VWFA domain-containing protein, partial [Podarcis lilfordi]
SGEANPVHQITSLPLLTTTPHWFSRAAMELSGSGAFLDQAHLVQKSFILLPATKGKCLAQEIGQQFLTQRHQANHRSYLPIVLGSKLTLTHSSSALPTALAPGGVQRPSTYGTTSPGMPLKGQGLFTTGPDLVECSVTRDQGPARLDIFPQGLQDRAVPPGLWGKGRQTSNSTIRWFITQLKPSAAKL